MSSLYRWGKGKSSDGAPLVSSGHPIIFDVVGGRTTAIVPAIQRKGLLLYPSAAAACGDSGGSGDGGPLSRASGGKAKPASASKNSSNAKASAGGGRAKTKAKAGRRKGKRTVDPKQEVEEEEDSTNRTKIVTAKKTIARKTSRAGVKKERAAHVIKKGAKGGVAGSKKSNLSNKKMTKLTPAAASAADKVKAEPVDVAKASQVKPPSRAAVTPKNYGRGNKKKTRLEQEKEQEQGQEHEETPSSSSSSVVAAPTKRGRGGGGGGGREDGREPASVKGKRAKTTTAVRRAVVKHEEIDATVVTAACKVIISKGRTTRTANRVGGRRSLRLSK